MTTAKTGEIQGNSSYYYPIFFALLLPFLIAFFGSHLLDFVGLLICLIAIYSPLIIIIKTVYDWTRGKSFFAGLLRHLRPIPSGMIYDTDLKTQNIPWVTATLVISNTFLFFLLPEEIVELGLFPPLGDPSMLHIAVSVFTSAFLHADFSHLAGNMIFLWVFGSATESRVGSLRFLFVYTVCIIASNVLDIVLLNLQVNYLNSTIEMGNYHSLGASGAIAGITGLFVVRCFFARVTVSFPFFFLPFVSVPLRIQAMLLISIYFALDLSGSIGQFEADGSQIDYWAHVGGYLGGFLMGYLMGLHKEAKNEALKVKARRYSSAPNNNKNTSTLYQEILDKEPENEEALKYFFNIHKYNPAKAEQYYTRIIRLLIRRNFRQALALFDEHFPNFLNALPGDILLRFGLHFFNNADLEKARTCLEIASEKKGAWQPKAMISLAQTFEGLGNKRYARQLYEDVLKSFPNSAFYNEAASILKTI